MAVVNINVPGFGPNEAETPIVILGPNGSGKTRLAQNIARQNQVSTISAQRRTWVEDTLPVEGEEQLRNRVRNELDTWRDNAWRPTQEMDFLLSRLIQEHAGALTTRNEQAILSKTSLDPIRDTGLMLLQGVWTTLFPKRKLEISGFFPTVRRLDGPENEKPYPLRQMSDGERTVLYMAVRVMTAENHIILVDEPELHMHSLLAVRFWDEAEKLRPDCRFIYVTHDLSFAMSRRAATVLVARSNDAAEQLLIDDLPSSVAAEVLGAATLPFYAQRVFFFEGEAGKGFASEFFSAWFDDPETFAIPAGDRNSVCAAVTGLKTVGVVAATVAGLVDRDYYPDDILRATTEGVDVLPLHEIESVVCDENVVGALASHLGKNPGEVSALFLARAQQEFRGQVFSHLVARRVRARVGDLLDNAFSGSQVVADLAETAGNHATALAALDLPAKTYAMFEEESTRVSRALAAGGQEMLAIVPGKHLLSLLPGILGLSNAPELTGLVIRSLNRKLLKHDDPLRALGLKLEAALQASLPARRVAPATEPAATATSVAPAA